MPRDVELAQLPSDLLVKVLAFLPVPELAKTSCLSRAFKSYSYCDALFVPKLAALGLDEEGRPLKAIERIPDKAAGAGLKSGAKANGARAGSPAIKDPAGANAAKAAQKRPEAPKQNRDKTSVFGSDTSKNPSLLDGLLDGGPGDGLPPALMDFPSLFQKKASETAFNAGTGKPREVFRKEYVECMDLYRPFRSETGGIDALASKFEDLPERAKVANRLKLFASLPFLGDAALILPRIMTGLQEFSNNLIASFSEASDVQDYDRMKEISQASFVLDGGAACVQLFLSKNPILYDSELNPSLLATNIPATAASDDFSLAENFANFMERLLTNVKTQTDIITKVFPPETQALSVYIQFIFQASISDYLSAVLQNARSGDPVAYLNTLTTAVTYCTQFLDEIDSQLEDKSIWNKDDVWTSVKGTFEPYYAGYLEAELKAQRERCERELTRWAAERLAKEKQKDPTPSAIVAGDVENFRSTMLSTMKTVLLAPSYLTRSLMQPFRASSQTEEKSPHFEFLKLDEHLTNLVSLELSLTMMHLNKDGVKRAIALAGAFNKADGRPFVQAIFVVLLRYLGTRHMNVGFSEAIMRLGNTKPSDDVNSLVVDSLSQFFELVHVADMIQQMVHIYYVDEIQNYVDESDFLSDVVVEKKQFEHVLDDQVASGMDSAIQVLMQQIEYILRNEQVVPEDFSPSASSAMDLTPTKACKKVVAMLYAHTRMIKGTTDKHILDIFFQEVGVRFHGVVTKHLKRQQISTLGGLRVICDLTEYYNWAISLRNSEVTKMFAVLKEVGNLYIVESAADLKEMVHDMNRYQGQMRVEEIYELLQGRADWKKIQKQVEVSDCTIM